MTGTTDGSWARSTVLRTRTVTIVLMGQASPAPSDWASIRNVSNDLSRDPPVGRAELWAHGPTVAELDYGAS
jgi:hypothetical protein